MILNLFIFIALGSLLMIIMKFVSALIEVSQSSPQDPDCNCLWCKSWNKGYVIVGLTNPHKSNWLEIWES